MKILAAFFALATVAATGAHAQSDPGDRATPGKRLPVGDYLCGLGSYKARPCTVTEEEGAFFLTVPADIGHSFPFKAQLLGTDRAKQLVLAGQLLAPNRLCSGDSPAGCQEQPLTAVLTRGGNGTWAGTMTYRVHRTDERGPYAHGVTERFVIRKAPRK